MTLLLLTTVCYKSSAMFKVFNEEEAKKERKEGKTRSRLLIVDKVRCTVCRSLRHECSFNLLLNVV